MSERFNTPERIKECKELMERKFGVETTKGSLFRTLDRAAYVELYGIKEWLDQTRIYNWKAETDRKAKDDD